MAGRRRLDPENKEADAVDCRESQRNKQPRAPSPSARICRTRGGATRYGSSIVAIITGPTTASAPSNAMSPVIPINGRIAASTASSGNCSGSRAPMHAAPIPRKKNRLRVVRAAWAVRITNLQDCGVFLYARLRCLVAERLIRCAGYGSFGVWLSDLLINGANRLIGIGRMVVVLGSLEISLIVCRRSE